MPTEDELARLHGSNGAAHRSKKPGARAEPEEVGIQGLMKFKPVTVKHTNDQGEKRVETEKLRE